MVGHVCPSLDPHPRGTEPLAIPVCRTCMPRTRTTTIWRTGSAFCIGPDRLTRPPPRVPFVTARGHEETSLHDGVGRDCWTVPAVYRSLKRAIAREVFQALTGNCAVPNYSDLRPARQAKNITLTAIAAALDVWPARVGELELGRRRDDDFANRYREWLTVA